jgi:hypothetical protein
MPQFILKNFLCLESSGYNKERNKALEMPNQSEAEVPLESGFIIFGGLSGCWAFLFCTTSPAVGI